MLLFFCTFVFLFVCFFFKKNLTIISLLTLYIVNKATIGLRVGITQRRNSKWPSCDVLILNFTILSSRRKNGISLLKFLEIKSILSPWGRVAVSNISLVALNDYYGLKWIIIYLIVFCIQFKSMWSTKYSCCCSVLL